MSIYLEHLITLLLIDKVKSFRNSYTLTKVLARKFDIINFVELIDELKSQGLINVYVRDGISNYELTSSGTLYLHENLETHKSVII